MGDFKLGKWEDGSWGGKEMRDNTKDIKKKRDKQITSQVYLNNTHVYVNMRLCLLICL